MKLLVVLTATLACSLAKPGLLGSTISTYSTLGSIPAPLGAPIASPFTAPIATRIAATPIATPLTAPIATRIAAAPIATPLTAPIATRIAAAPIATPLTAPIATPLGAPIATPLGAPIATRIAAGPISTTVTQLATPLAAPIATALTGHTQYHAQDVIGQASYGHNEALQAHHAIQDATGNKIGSFSYLSPEGSVLRTDYVADALGYRVASNALPVGPSAPIADTAEVVAAKAAHAAAHIAAKSRVRRQILAAPFALGHTPAATVPLATSLITPLAPRIAAPIATPLAIGYTPAATAPLVRTLIL